MKLMIKYLILTSLLICGLAAPLSAKDIYVTGVTKITMRTGPGTEHKIVVMLTSGTKLEIVEYQKDWSMVKTAQGKSGWVLSRFLTQEVPKALMVKQLEKENQELIQSLDTAQAKAKDLETKNTALEGIEKKYKQLEQASADYLKLDAKYKDLLKNSEEQQTYINALEANMNNEEKIWFLSGAGVFILGLIIGVSTRKKKRSSLLS
ncbi:MAG: TIGR04211 family SH3 domain-containing protein [Desulfobacter sp.]|nr:TIGR04211 family SH3 domain-containing protein [Desulfobacter sp.]WDP85139.1 MAG: TIGR04211 family SH3 domain-containing protein [Desulfobacter sp.]